LRIPQADLASPERFEIVRQATDEMFEVKPLIERLRVVVQGQPHLRLSE
jgi:hypothetical protein